MFGFKFLLPRIDGRAGRGFKGNDGTPRTGSIDGPGVAGIG